VPLCDGQKALQQLVQIATGNIMLQGVLQLMNQLLFVIRDRTVEGEFLHLFHDDSSM
jgi:hypothetical protein